MASSFFEDISDHGFNDGPNQRFSDRTFADSLNNGPERATSGKTKDSGSGSGSGNEKYSNEKYNSSNEKDSGHERNSSTDENKVAAAKEEPERQASEEHPRDGSDDGLVAVAGEPGKKLTFWQKVKLHFRKYWKWHLLAIIILLAILLPIL